jgi:hypothetical protein
LAFASPTPSLSALARHRLRTLPPIDLRTPEERRRDREELLLKVKRMRPDLHERVAPLMAGADRDWYELLKCRLGEETALDVAEIAVSTEYGQAPTHS